MTTGIDRLNTEVLGKSVSLALNFMFVSAATTLEIRLLALGT